MCSIGPAKKPGAKKHCRLPATSPHPRPAYLPGGQILGQTVRQVQMAKQREKEEGKQTPRPRLCPLPTACWTVFWWPCLERTLVPQQFACGIWRVWKST